MLPVQGSIAKTKGGASGSSATSAATIALGIDPTISATGNAVVPSNASPGSADAFANPGLQYEFDISGPTPTVLVDVTANGQVTTSIIPQYNLVSSGGAGAEAQIISNIGLSESISCGLSALGCSHTFSGGTFTLNTGQTYSVQINASVDGELTSLYNTSSVNVDLTASVDPMFTIDPSVLNAGLFTFDFSPGLISTTTPLPATLPLFATGLGALGLFGWRMKRKNAAAIAAALIG